MTTPVPQEQTKTAPANVTTKARVSERRAAVAPSKRKPARKASGAKKAVAARHGSKTAKILALLKRPGGVTLKELTKVTGWKVQSVRGFLSGTIGKKMGTPVVSTKRADDARSYHVSK